MNTGLTRLLSIRPRLISRHAHVGLPVSVTKPAVTPPDTMLGRARDRAAKPPALTSSAARSDLARQLFPSSSPSTKDGNIATWASTNKHDSSSCSRPDPLQTKPSNLQTPSWNSTRSSTYPARPDNSLATICHNAASFQDNTTLSRGESLGETAASVFIDDDDFSDDNTLELDYECPASLPSRPPVAASASLPTTSPAPQSSQTIPWSSSPQHHMFPPTVPRSSSLKRPSPEEPKRFAPPPAKKRTLPKSWARTEPAPGPSEQDEPLGKVVRGTKPMDTPKPKKKTDLPWDATQSATKERRRQLKSQNKRSDHDQDLSKDEIKAIADEHAAQKTKMSAISLSSEQQQVIDLVIKEKRSVFFTGPAGTGKSVLMRAIIAELKKKWARDPERLSVTASTGLAACNIGGQTLHSFAGIGLGKEDVPTLVKKIRRNAKAKNRWLRTSTLVIDEVSMVDGDLFDKLSRIACQLRNNGRAFGGIQLIITGDFFQLPPVPDGGKKEAKFAFDAATWNTSIDHTIGLTQVFRQRDPDFAGMLNEMRLGRISESTVSTFKGLSRPLTFDDGLDVTELFPTRQEVERSNEFRLRNLPGETHHFEALDSGDPNVKDKLLANMMAPKAIDLKKGAQVMLIKNMDDTLVNGSLGKVIGFMSEATFEIWSAKDVSIDSGDEADADMRSKKKIKAYSREPETMKDLKEYPIVRFTATDGTHRILLCIPEDWKVELPTGEVQASRKQLPLILAWALSIHKAQGQTLERVKVDLGKVFEKGQAYVALSRAVSKQGLQVLRFEKSKVMAHARVISFYNQLYSADSIAKPKKLPTIADFAHRGGSRTKRQGIIDMDEEEAATAAYG